MAAAAASASLFSKPNSKPSYPAIKYRNSLSTPTLFLNPHLSLPSLLWIQKSFTFRPCSAVQEISVVEEEEKEEAGGETLNEEEKRRKLYVANLPWNYSAPDLEKLFGECGTVKDVEIIKQQNGRSRGFAFITMATGEESRAAVDKFDSFELMGRIIRVEFAKSFRKPSPPPPPGSPVVETRHKIYASNLAWKVRSINLRNFFSDKFKPVSARVVLDNPSGKSTGYGFVSFATKEEAEAAISELDGKELMGRPLRLRISQKTTNEPGSEPEDTGNTEQRSEES